MPAQQGKSNITGKLKQAVGGSVKKHRTDETVVPGGGDLPSGIENGIAQLVEAKIDEHKEGEHKGKLFAFFSGVVVSVGADDPQGCIGRRASKLVFLYPSKDGKKSMDDRVSELLNEMRLLGCDTSNMGEDDIESALEVLKGEAPHFAFRTWKGKATTQYPNPRTNTTFNGLVEATGEAGGGSTGGVDDSSGGDTEGSSDTPSDSSGEGEDWAALGEQADGGDSEAAEKLAAAGKEYGVDTDAAENWSVAAKEIAEKASSGGGDGGAAEANNAEWKPEIDDVFDYRPKGARKDIQIKVTAVFSKTLNAKSVEDNKPFKGLAWAADPPSIDGKPI